MRECPANGSRSFSGEEVGTSHGRTILVWPAFHCVQFFTYDG
jgi:hypothetical protein